MATPAPNAPRIFVSHSHQDNAYCREYVEGLRARGYAVWYDEHNLGWGALRPTIERELPRSQHFVAIFSPAAVASEWVNTEIDAALDLLKAGTLRTLTFVVAAACVVPLLLRRWKRIEGPAGAAVSAAEAVARTVAIVAGQGDAVATPGVVPGPSLPSRGPAPVPTDATPAYHLTPTALYNLGFRGYSRNGVEFMLPPLCPVPGGVFTMGSDKTQDKEAYDDETPQYPVEVASFAIGQHPVTMAEYACAVRAKAVREPPAYTIPKDATWASAARRGTTVDWAAQLKQPDHPVVCVVWNDAVAYGGWLARVSGQAWRLPTEAQWEKAARWDPAGPANQVPRRYPWGDTFDKARCNTSEAGIGATTPVGRYPGGASPCGAQDMAGNVWEWTSTLFKPYPYHAQDGRERADSTENRTLRGGSWDHAARGARAACRSSDPPDLFLDYLGFRLALVSGAGS